MVIFQSADQKRWWNRATRPGFEHCYTLSWDNYQQAHLMLEWTLYGVEQMVVSGPDWESLHLHIRENEGTIVGTRLLGSGESHPLYHVGANCVSLVKHTLRIKPRWIWTPYQLYRYILQRGGREILTWRDQ